MENRPDVGMADDAPGACAPHPTGHYCPLPAAALDAALLPRFAEMVARFPDQLALCAGARRLTYRELDQAANRVAQGLLARALDRTLPVALLFELEADWIIATLGVWKAGLFWVCLDPDHPEARLRMILDDAQPGLILASEARHGLAATLSTPSCGWATVSDLAANQSHQAPAVTVCATDFAYLVYTSGTTGKPKGVIENHTNLLHMAAERGAAVQPSSADRLGLLLAPSAGGAVYTIVLALWHGAALMLLDMLRDGLAGFEAWLVREAITGIHAGVVLRTWLLTLDGTRQFPALRFLILGAAPAYARHVLAFQRYLGEHCLLVNPYSAAEARTITLERIDPTTPMIGATVPVGYPPPWVTVAIWDEAGQPVAAGQSGEIVVLSAYLSPGYWRNPALTAARFGVDAGGRRFYRTGDLGKLDADGRLWMLGRMDGQIKIRGHRVEPAEIETALREHGQVGDVAVVAAQTEEESPYLVAFVAPAAEGALDTTELRRLLAVRLPRHMHPAEFRLVASLPTNPYGKVDRAALQRLVVQPIAGADTTGAGMGRTRISLEQQVAVAAHARHPHADHIPFDSAEAAGSLLVRWAGMVRRFGDRPALREGDFTLTYAQVDALTDEWARAILARRGVGTEAVGLVFSLEADLPLAVLAVWKAGKYLVWIEPEQPAARTRLILEDAEIGLILTNAQTHAFVEAVAGAVSVMVIDSRGDVDAAAIWAHAPLPLAAADDVACLFYTSGTTGRPKGVVERQRNLVHTTRHRSAYVHLCAEDRVSLMVAGAGMLHSITTAWCHGALLLPFRFRSEGLVRFNKWLVENGVTFLNGGGVLRTWLLALDGREAFPAVRVLSMGAAPLYREHVTAMQRFLSPDCVLLNIYSASEGRTFSHLLLDHATELSSRLAPVGYAGDGVTVQVWNETGAALPTGEVGELVVFSPYLSDGYWRLPELTASRFGVDDAGRRFYRTGDLGRMEADGLVWVLGRRDGQVKIRGFRVETAEVEVALLDAPGVQQAAVLAEGDDDSARRLVAFVGMGEEAAQDGEVVGMLRQYLAARLPDYMIPTEIYVRADLPHTHLRKIDRTALRAQLAQTAGVVSRHAASLSQIGGALTAAQPVAPGSGATDAGLASEIERQVAQMVAELLARAQVGRDENFFEVGGHSLLAARLMLRIHRQWGIDLPPRHFFAHPTVAALAVAVEQALDKPNPTDAAPQGIHAVPVVEGAAGRLPFFLMAGGGGSTVELLWYRDFIHNLGEDQPVYALLAHGPLGRGAIYASVGEMVVDAIAAVRRIQPHGPYLLGGECIGGKLAYEMARLLEQEGEEVALLLLLDTALPDGPTHRPAPSVQRWWRRMHYHWTHVQRLGWRAGTSHALELAGRALPPRLYANPHVRDAQAVREAYRRLLTDYAPAERYGRSLVVIFSAETQSRRQAWQKLAAEVDEHVVEGTHQTYLSVAVHQTAAKARSYLRRAQGLSATE